MPRRVTAFIAALLLFAAAAVAVWYVKTGHELDRVGFTPGPPHCTGTTVTTQPEDDPEDLGPPMREPLIRAKRGMHCTITYRAQWNTEAEISMTHLLVGLGGPEAVSPFVVTSLQHTTPEPARDGLDAVWSGPPDVPAHVVIEIGFRRNGCNEKGSATGVAPRVTLASHGRTVQRRLPTFWVSGGGVAKSCID